MQRTLHPSGGRRAGVTLVEVLAVVSVVALLVGLLLPAVQRVRAAAARATCQNNLKQIVLAAHNYEQARGVIPRNSCAGNPSGFSCFSAQARLLPYLDQAPVHALIDWTDQTLDMNGPPRANPANVGLLRQPIAGFVCPADAEARPWSNSYRMNAGWSFPDVAVMGRFDFLPSRMAGFTDGLSQTALFSERLVASESGRDRRNPLWVAVGAHELGPACAEVQLDGPPANAGDPYAGSTWLRGSDRHTNYIHLFPPNSRLCDCNSAVHGAMSLMSARSGHSGGVNVSFADGHIVFMADRIGLAAWRAAGSPTGGEIVRAE